MNRINYYPVDRVACFVYTLVNIVNHLSNKEFPSEY